MFTRKHANNVDCIHTKNVILKNRNVLKILENFLKYIFIKLNKKLKLNNFRK